MTETPEQIVCSPQNLDFLTPNSYILTIDRIPGVAFTGQSFTTPSINLPRLDQPTPFSNPGIPSDKLSFEPLQVTFMIDAALKNYLEVMRWMFGLGFPEEYQQYINEMNTRDPKPNNGELPTNYSDVRLTILSALNRPLKTFQYVDCFPTNLTGINFASTNSEVPYANATVTLEYSYFREDN